MLTDILVNTFVKDPALTENVNVRNAMGKLSGAVGIAANTLLFLAKLAIGFITGSVTVIADAFNNLSDAASSVVSLAGFKLASAAADAEHPFGHGRYEYLAGLTVAVLVAGVGFSLGWSSLQKIIGPDEMEFSGAAIAVLIASILLKMWLAGFYSEIGSRIRSGVLTAAAADSKMDFWATAAALLSMLLCHFTGIARFDGILGLGVSLLIIWNGLSLIRGTLSPLLGERPQEDLVRQIRDTVMAHPEVLGMHDLIVHDYGPGHCFASLHIELPAEASPLDSHELIDSIEAEFRQKGIDVVIHYDPVVTGDPRVAGLRDAMREEVKNFGDGFNVHDLRIVAGKKNTLVLVDLVIPPKRFKDAELYKDRLEKRLKEIDPSYSGVIKAEETYSGI